MTPFPKDPWRGPRRGHCGARLPRDLSGEDLAKALHVLGYETTMIHGRTTEPVAAGLPPSWSGRRLVGHDDQLDAALAAQGHQNAWG